MELHQVSDCGSSDEMVYRVPNFFAQEGSRFLPHLIKTIKNIRSNTKRKLWVSRCIVCIDLIFSLVQR